MTTLPTTAYPLPNYTPSVPAQYGIQFSGSETQDEPGFQFEDLERYTEVSPSLWLPYFSGNSQQNKPHSLVILA